MTTAMNELAFAARTGGFGIPSVTHYVAEPAQHALAVVINGAPTVAAAIGAFLALWLVARIARIVTVRVLQLVKLDAAIDETLISRIFSGLGEGSTPSKALG